MDVSRYGPPPANVPFRLHRLANSRGITRTLMTDRHADPIDEANLLAASLTEQAIAAARKGSEPEKHPDFDGSSCIDCGDDIPKDRLKLGRIRCVRCQTIKEKKNAMYYRGPSSGLAYLD